MKELVIKDMTQYERVKQQLVDTIPRLPSAIPAPGDETWEWFTATSLNIRDFERVHRLRRAPFPRATEPETPLAEE